MPLPFSIFSIQTMPPRPRRAAATGATGATAAATGATRAPARGSCARGRGRVRGRGRGCGRADDMPDLVAVVDSDNGEEFDLGDDDDDDDDDIYDDDAQWPGQPQNPVAPPRPVAPVLPIIAPMIPVVPPQPAPTPKLTGEQASRVMRFRSQQLAQSLSPPSETSSKGISAPDIAHFFVHIDLPTNPDWQGLADWGTATKVPTCVCKKCE